MSAFLEIACAQLLRADKGDDRFLVRALNDPSDSFLLVVADGLTMNDGAAAAAWICDFLETLIGVDTIWNVYRLLVDALGAASLPLPDSETTVTCGILSRADVDDSLMMEFNYFAIGDSPIWRVVKGDDKYPVQRYQIHGSPYPSESARVYSTVRLQSRRVEGNVSFGSTFIGQDEVLVVCSDGLSEREVLVRDLKDGFRQSNGLAQWMVQDVPYNEVSLARTIMIYENDGVLFDDLTVLIARIRPSIHPDILKLGDACINSKTCMSHRTIGVQAGRAVAEVLHASLAESSKQSSVCDERDLTPCDRRVSVRTGIRAFSSTMPGRDRAASISPSIKRPKRRIRNF